MLRGRRIVLGITGSIAAYKAAFLTRLLVKAGAEVKVIMTPAAREFISPLTLATLSRNPVLSDFTSGPDGTWNNHVDLGLWGDLLLIAPASANTVAKMAGGICDNLLMATYLSARCPVVVAPAMDLDMLQHPATQANLTRLLGFGNRILEPGFGELASGLTGKGRMAEPEEILQLLSNHFSGGRLKGVQALVTAGPTHEAVDPVRFIGNHSTGKMGFAIADALAREGADVQLVAGPTQVPPPAVPGITVHKVDTADQMNQACQKIYPASRVTVLAAAVADYRPAEVAAQKIKKGKDGMVLELVRTTDIAATLGKTKRNDQYLVGFALETENEVSNASHKLETKNFDLIVLNSLNDEGAGFGHDTNRVTLIERSGRVTRYPLKSKQEVARDIVTFIADQVAPA
jgi:phosphopantothenoylcysteine decarboxylase/phosphopantothenate--cysteine ligase